MAQNALYDYARELFLTGQINWLADSGNGRFKLLLTNSLYTPDTANHKFVSMVGAEARVGSPTGVPLMNCSATGGAADADDVVFTSVTGDTVQNLILYEDKGQENMSPLIAAIGMATGLPITPNGGDIIVTWDNGSNKIFKL